MLNKNEHRSSLIQSKMNPEDYPPDQNPFLDIPPRADMPAGKSLSEEAALVAVQNRVHEETEEIISQVIRSHHRSDELLNIQDSGKYLVRGLVSLIGELQAEV